jgi:hypothetical protein
MAEPPRSGDKHSQRLDEELARDPGDEAENTEVDLWDSPGRDGVVGDAETDPDRTDLRSAIGQYVSLVAFPTDGATLTATAGNKDAPDEVLAELRALDPDATFQNTAELWDALGLSSGRRF